MDETEMGAPVAPPRKPWLKGFLLGSAILACGIVIGAAATYRFLGDGSGDFPPSPEKRHEAIMKRLRHELNLSDEQAQRVSEIFNRKHEKMEMIRAKVEPEVSSLMDEVRAEVGGLLHPDQQVLWEKHLTEMRARMHARPHGAASGTGSSPETESKQEAK